MAARPETTPERDLGRGSGTERAARSNGRMFSLTLDAFRHDVPPAGPVREFVRVSWFIASVSRAGDPRVTAFGMVHRAARSGTSHGSSVRTRRPGAAMVLAIVREAAPIATALLIAGAAGSAMTADLGSRKIRRGDRRDGGLGRRPPVHRLSVPRIWASVFVADPAGRFREPSPGSRRLSVNVILQGGTAGAYLNSFSLLAQPWDPLLALLKAGIFGWSLRWLPCTWACRRGRTERGR